MGNVVQVHERIWQIQAPFGEDGLVMLYVLRGNKLALVDTGVSTSPLGDVRPALKSLGLNLSDVGVVLNTHGHHDHLGGNASLKREAPNAQIHLHRADEPFAHSHEFHYTFMTEFLKSYGHEDQIPARQAALVKTLGEGDAGVDRLLDDGDRIDLGGGIELTVIHSPGHTMGSVCFYWESEKVLLSGDSIQARGSRAGGWPLYWFAADYRRSMQRLLDVPVETLGLGHGFHTAAALNTPMKHGVEARRTLEESMRVANALEAAVRRQLEANPSASDLEIARAATLDVLDQIPTQIDPVLRLPGAGATSLWAHIREARG